MPVTFDALRPLVESLPSILMLSSLDGPGAGDAAVRLQTGLTAAGVDVTMYVLKKSTNCNVMSISKKGPNLYNVYSVMSRIALRSYPDHSSCFEMFSINKTPLNLESIPKLQTAGIVHFNWVSGMVGFPYAKDVLQGKPVVWSMMDMNPLSGGCHYTAGCDMYVNNGCRSCPQLGNSTDGMDLAAETFAVRRTSYAEMNIATVAHAKWMKNCAEQSLLLASSPCSTIPTCVDPYIFSPQPRSWARAVWGISPQRKVILFGASGVHRRNKGLHILKQALELLRSQWKGELPLLFIFGGAAHGILPEGYAYLTLDRLNPSELAKAYSAADVFVSPSFQDNLPNTVNESLSCGTPVICFNRYSSEDVVIDGVTGYTAEHPGLPIAADGSLLQDPAYSVSQEQLTNFVNKIVFLLTLPAEEYEDMRIRCSKKSREFFSPVLRTARHLRLYRRLADLSDVAIEGLPE
jgi:glycosyltransferase involved in cell wall biosynthesis